MKIRKTAEKKYLREGKVSTRTFTDPAKMRREREIAKKYGVKGAYQPKRKTPSKGAATKKRGFITDEDRINREIKLAKKHRVWGAYNAICKLI